MKWLPVAIFALIAVFLWRGLSLDPGKLPSPLIDKAAPAISVARLPLDATVRTDDGADERETATIDSTAAIDSSAAFDSKELEGQIWILNVWASWCGPCAQEHPQLVALADMRDVPIVGLNYKDEPDQARRWLARFGNIFSTVLDDGDGRVGLDWGVYGVPETFIIDAAGRVRLKHVGPLLPGDIEGVILPALDQLEVAS